ncbi:serine hydrolase [Alkalihalobacillus sp. 1P02AB]|uniref:serine hydrolase n=1 Tax=Alkalihalobacillus sp. 1P02AB TaxID=3132260 RepID=UPI0039A4F469
MSIKQITNKLDEILTELMTNEPIPGLAIAVTQGEQKIYMKGFGVMNMEMYEAVTKETLFHTASISKTFVALAIMQLVEKGDLNLDEPIISYLPYFCLADERYCIITTRDLLSHCSGIPNEYEFNWGNPEYDELAIERYVKSKKNEKLNFTPSEKFEYSNTAFEILGDIIQKVSGRPFEKYVEERILKPLSMNESSFLNKELNRSKIATPHILSMDGTYGPKVSPVFPYNRRHAASSTLCTSLEEMTNYAIMMHNKGLFQEQSLIGGEYFAEMFEPVQKTNWGEEMDEVGLAWFIGQYKGRKMYSHSGLDTGFRSNLIVLPEKKISIILFTNNDYSGTAVIWKAVLDVVIGEKVDGVKRSLARFLAKSLIESGEKVTLEEFKRIKGGKIDVGFNVLEAELNYVAYELFEDEKVDEGIALLKMAVELFLESTNLHDSLGEMYQAKGDRVEATRYFKKAIELNPTNDEAIEHLRALVEEEL